MPSYEECLMQLQRLIHAVCGQRRQENMEAYSREVRIIIAIIQTNAPFLYCAFNNRFKSLSLGTVSFPCGLLHGKMEMLSISLS